MQSPDLQDYSGKGQLTQRHFNVSLTNSVANTTRITMIIAMICLKITPAPQHHSYPETARLARMS